jgi:hypothetical protein
MGLDMYLSVRKYVSQMDWSKDGAKEKNPVYTEMLQANGLDKCTTHSAHAGANVEAVAVYWRKANAIHQWFVGNCADGEDDCRPMWVGREKLENLLTTVKEAIETQDSSELPPSSGFFFGSTEVDEYYWEELEYTRKALEELLSVTEGEDIDFLYQASW